MLTYNYTNLVVANVTKIDGLTLLNVFNKQFNSMLLGLHTLTHLKIPLTNLSQKNSVTALRSGGTILFVQLLIQVKKDVAQTSQKRFCYMKSNLVT